MRSLEIHHSRSLTIEDVCRFARGEVSLGLSPEPEFRQRIEVNRAFLEDKLQGGADIYGVTTGFGDSSRNRLTPDLACELQQNLVRYHGVGVGAFLSEEACAATLLIRLNTVARGYSGVSWGLLEQFERLGALRLFPAIPEQGSVGASGDLTPLSYVAAGLQGERRAWHQGVLHESRSLFAEHGLAPYRLREKEGLAVMNGTSVMTAVAALAWERAHSIARMACTVTGVLAELLECRSTPFMPEIHALKPHPGQKKAAELIAAHITSCEKRIERRARASNVTGETMRDKFRLQDSYSLRCAPQVIGVLFDALTWTRGILEIEINSVTDNPVFDSDIGMVLNGGHFFGAHVAAACDCLKTAVANVLNLLDKQIAILVDSRLNEGLFPDNLVNHSALGSRRYIHHGFKAAQITLSALVAEALKTSLPMGIFSRSTECLNQDVVSMGTICARDLTKVVEMGETVSAIHAMALRQAVSLRSEALEGEAAGFVERVAAAFAPVLEDRPLDADIVAVRDALFGRKE